MAMSFRFLAPVYTERVDVDDVERIVRGFRDVGFTVSPESVSSAGTENPVVEYEHAEDEYGDPKRSGELPKVVETIVDEGGAITLYLDDYEVDVAVSPDNNDGDPSGAPLGITGLKGAFFGDELADERVAEIAAVIVEGIALTARQTEPWGITGTFFHPEGGLEAELPDSPPPETTLEMLPWVTVFGPSWCADLSGKDRLLETPAWNVRELDTGAVLVRKTEVYEPGWYPHERRSGKLVVSPTEYVFGGWQTTDAEEIRAQIREKGSRDHLDPHRALEDGEYASDLVMCKDHAPFEMGETDYTEIMDADLDHSDGCPVLRLQRKGDALYGADSGIFIRRLVDDHGQPIGERPPDVPPEHEMLSMTLLLEDERQNPIEWYRLDDPDDRSLSTRLQTYFSHSPGENFWELGEAMANRSS